MIRVWRKGKASPFTGSSAQGKCCSNLVASCGEDSRLEENEGVPRLHWHGAMLGGVKAWTKSGFSLRDMVSLSPSVLGPGSLYKRV